MYARRALLCDCHFTWPNIGIFLHVNKQNSPGRVGIFKNFAKTSYIKPCPTSINAGFKAGLTVNG
jgi:hypothetical protein